MSQLANIEDIPGYREAIECEREIREAPFAGLPEFVGPVEVRAFTPIHWMRLNAAKSPFMRGGIPKPSDTALFLWCVSPEYEAAFRVQKIVAPWSNRLARGLFGWMRNKFYRRLRGQSWDELALGCIDYLDEAFMDSPGVRVDDKGFNPSYFSPGTARIVEYGETCGWIPSVTLNLPFKILFQIENYLKKRGNPNAILFNPSDKVRSAWLRQQEDRKHD